MAPYPNFSRNAENLVARFGASSHLQVIAATIFGDFVCPAVFCERTSLSEAYGDPARAHPLHALPLSQASCILHSTSPPTKPKFPYTTSPFTFISLGKMRLFIAFLLSLAVLLQVTLARPSFVSTDYGVNSTNLTDVQLSSQGLEHYVWCGVYIKLQETLVNGQHSDSKHWETLIRSIRFTHDNGQEIGGLEYVDLLPFSFGPHV
jgi:hypothetical protein